MKTAALIVVVVGMLSTACGSSADIDPSLEDEVSSEDALRGSHKAPLGQIVEVVGRVERKAEKGGAWRRVSVGTNLYFGDLVRTVQGTRAVIRCTTTSRTLTITDGDWAGVNNVCNLPD